MDFRLAVTCILLGAGAACGDGPSPAAAEIQERTVAIRLEPSSVSFDALGDTVRMRVLRSTSSGGLIEEPAAQWTTTGDSAATVGADGVVTSVANGSVRVRARVGDLVADASVVVQQVPDTVLVVPEVTPVVAGKSIRLQARVFDRLWNDMTETTPVEWRSLEPHAVHVASPGLLQAVIEDTAVVEARAGDAVGAAVVVVVPEKWPNEPAGFTALTDQSWSELASNGWSHQNRGAYSHIVSDPTAPHSGSSVLEHVYPEGFTADGTEPAVEWINAGGKKDVYLGFWFKASEGWQGHAESGINKIFFMWDTEFKRNIMLTMRGGTDGPFRLEIHPEGHTESHVREASGISGYLPQNVNQAELIPGRWHRIEIRVSYGTGTVEWWQDGVQLGSHTGLQLDGTGFGELQIAPTWGGRGTLTKQQDDYFRFDHFRISTGGD